MPFHSKFNFGKIIQSLTAKGLPQTIGFKYSSWDSLKFRNLAKIKQGRFSKILAVLPPNEAAELSFAYRLAKKSNDQLPWSEPISGKKAEEIIRGYLPLPSESSVFKVKKSDLTELLNSVSNKNAYRFIVKFGCTDADTGLSLLLTAMEAKESDYKQIGSYIECVDVASNAATTPKDIDKNFNDKTQNYFTTRASSDSNRRGIAHYIQTVSKPNKIGIEEFMASRKDGDAYLYLHMGKGDIKIKEVLTTSKDYTTIVFSHFSSISKYSTVGAESNIFYDISGACCPPA